jgi:hypothetical protein
MEEDGGLEEIRFSNKSETDDRCFNSHFTFVALQNRCPNLHGYYLSLFDTDECSYGRVYYFHSFAVDKDPIAFLNDLLALKNEIISNI